MLKEPDSEGVPVEVIRIASFNGESVLTARQELILKMAFERGEKILPAHRGIIGAQEISNTLDTLLV